MFEEKVRMPLVRVPVIRMVSGGNFKSRYCRCHSCSSVYKIHFLLPVAVPSQGQCRAADADVGLSSYGVYRFGTTTNFMILTFFNMAIYMSYMMVLHRELRASRLVAAESIG